MISGGVGPGQERITPSGHRVRVVEVYIDRVHDTPRVNIRLSEHPQPTPFLQQNYSVETVRRWKLV